MEDRLAPQRIATFGEVSAKHGIDISELSKCESYWANMTSMSIDGAKHTFPQDFHWRRSSAIKSQGSVIFSSVMGSKSKVSRVLFESNFGKDINWVDFFREWCDVTSPVAAVLHPFIKEDGPHSKRKDVREYSYEEEVSQQAWSRFLRGDIYTEFRAGELNSAVTGLTNLGWATYLGDEFAREVNVQAIKAAGFLVSEIGGGYIIQISEKLGNVIGQYPSFSERRSQLKSLFRPGLFLIGDEPFATDL